MIRSGLGRATLLALAAMGLCGVVAWEYATMPGFGDSPAERTVAVQAPASPRRSSPGSRGDKWLREVLARPIFSPDRRPAEAAARQLGGFRLAGIILSDTGRVAILARVSGGRAVIVAEGAEVDGSKVLEVNESGVVLLGSAGRMSLTPTYDPAAPARPASITSKAAGRP